MNLPKYDELHVVSDLHMGGAPRLSDPRRDGAAGALRPLGRRPAAGRPGRARPERRHRRHARRGRGRLHRDRHGGRHDRAHRRSRPAFSPIWDALAEFVNETNRTLVLVIGNHDLELALPPVQRLRSPRLAGEDLAARARIEFSTIGAGYACLVGNTRVFCTHGNEVDAWNYVRYEDLTQAGAPAERRSRRSLRRVGAECRHEDGQGRDERGEAPLRLDRSAQAGDPGGGRRAAVLEPARRARSLACSPSSASDSAAAASTTGRLSADGFAAGGGGGAARPRRSAPRPEPGRGPARPAAGRTDARAMLLAGGAEFPEPSGRPCGPPTGRSERGQVVWDRLTGWITGVGKDEALRRALIDWLADDKTFELDDRDDTFTEITASVGADIDITSPATPTSSAPSTWAASRFYFNCGTWIRLHAVPRRRAEGHRRVQAGVRRVGRRHA